MLYGNPFTFILAALREFIFNRMTLAEMLSQYLSSSEKSPIKNVKMTVKK